MGKYYAVHKGRTPGIYFTWEDCQKQVDEYPGSVFKCFPTVAVAELFARKGPEKYKLAVRTLLHRDAWVISSDDEDDYIDSQTNRSGVSDEKKAVAPASPIDSGNNNNNNNHVNNSPSPVHNNNYNNNCYSDSDSDGPPICQFYMTDGCKFGDNCRFFHPPDDFFDDSDSDDVPVCKFWQRGFCKKGAMCDFYHD